MEEVEIWKDIPEYKGLYQVSNFGKIKSLERTIIYKDGRKKILPEKILKLRINNVGYYYFNIYGNNIKKSVTVHRLVATVFLENPYNYPCVNHKDCNPLNNHVDNLEWCTYQYNNTYNNAHIKRGEKLKGKKHSEEHKQKISKANKGENSYWYGKHHSDETKKKISRTKKGHIAPNRKPILQFSLDGVFIRDWQSATQASTELNLSQGNITACCRGERNKCGGFIWKYKGI